MARRASEFQAVRTEGGMLPPDLLRRITTSEIEDGLRPQDFDLPEGEKTNEAISQAWARLQKHWKEFVAAKDALAADQRGTEITNQKWLLPLFSALGYGKLTTSTAPVIDDKTYPISRFWDKTPIHLVGCNISLDKRTPGVKGAATSTPHSMVQEFLNRSDDHLWAFVSNGLRLRILRDNIALSRQSYVEFDLEAIFDGEVYSDFGLLWLLCHCTRVETGEDGKPDSCWLERWSQSAHEQGTRILEDLRVGVERAIEAFGRGFVSHPRNDRLRERLRNGDLSTQDFYRQVLRQVYRLLFLFVAEDRELLHPPLDESSSEAQRTQQLVARAIYDSHYSSRRLRDLALNIRGSRHCDLWYALSLVYKALQGEPADAQVRDSLVLPEFGSYLWNPNSTSDLNGPGTVEEATYLSNQDLLEAVRHLAFVEQDKMLRVVDYKNMGSEELGSVYESLLELHPEINIHARQFALRVAAGSERKTTGSYYTPDSLVQCLLDSALEPVVEDRLKDLKAAEDREEAILNLRVCDPAVGSGHFLIAAAHRLARHLARIRAVEQGNAEPTPEVYQHALRDVIRRCLYGVDINPMAAELCKVALWIESIDPGKPLSFLDHHIKVGNSLLGTTPNLMAQGIPDDAFKPLEGDDKEVVKYYKKRNKQERKDIATGQRTLLDELRDKFRIKLGNLPATIASLNAEDPDTASEVAEQARRYEQAVTSSPYESAKLLADAWCAAFVWRKHDSDGTGAVKGRPGEWDAITESIYRAIEENPHSVETWIKNEIRRLAKEYQFFHWHLEFPEVFGWYDSPPVNGHLSEKVAAEA